jgi:hypothetical protein
MSTSISEKIQGIGGIIKAVGGVIALFPGILFLLGIVELPNAMAKTATIVAFSVSVVVIIAVFLLGDWLEQLSKGRAIIYSVSAVMISGMIVIAYSEFAESHVIQIPAQTGRESLAIPLNPSADLLLNLDPATPGHPDKMDYEQRLVGGADPASFKELLYHEGRSTRLIMYLMLLVSQVLLIAPVIAAAWKLASVASPVPAPARPRRRRAKAGVKNP